MHSGGAATTACGELLARSSHSLPYWSATTIDTKAFAAQLRVDGAAVPVVTEAQGATTAARLERVAGSGHARVNLAAATPLATSLGNALDVSAAVLQDMLELLFPSRLPELLHFLGRHACSFLVHPSELPPVFRADGPQPALVSTATMLGMRHQSVHVTGELDLSVDLRLLVLHGAHLGGVAQHCGFARFGDLDRLRKFVLAILGEHMRVVVQHSQAVGLQIRRVLWGESATEPAIPQDEVRVSVLRTLHDTAVVVHRIEDAVLATLEAGSAIVRPPEEISLPLLADSRLQQSTGVLRLELVSVMRVALHERDHLVQVDMENDRGQFPDVSQGHPQVGVLVAHLGHPLLQLRQSLLMVALGKPANIPHRMPLRRGELTGLVELLVRTSQDQPPIRLLPLHDASRLQILNEHRWMCTRRAPHPVLRGHALPPGFKQREAAVHPADVALELVEAHGPVIVRIDRRQNLLDIIAAGRKT
mmetsp:Transcript_75616/g.219590  ORF Transcript_75616/g.219590 Transcript_75616/m.219590 type:complete len:476 (-) Transcript_75616:419-1846(-)